MKHYLSNKHGCSMKHYLSNMQLTLSACRMYIADKVENMLTKTETCRRIYAEKDEKMLFIYVKTRKKCFLSMTKY